MKKYLKTFARFFFLAFDLLILYFIIVGGDNGDGFIISMINGNLDATEIVIGLIEIVLLFISSLISIYFFNKVRDAVWVIFVINVFAFLIGVMFLGARY